MLSFAKTRSACIFNEFLKPRDARNDDVTLRLRRSQIPARTPVAAWLSAPERPYTMINMFSNHDSKRSNFSKFGGDGFRRQ